MMENNKRDALNKVSAYMKVFDKLHVLQAKRMVSDAKQSERLDKKILLLKQELQRRDQALTSDQLAQVVKKMVAKRLKNVNDDAPPRATVSGEPPR